MMQIFCWGNSRYPIGHESARFRVEAMKINVVLEVNMNADNKKAPKAEWIKFASTSAITVVVLGVGFIQFGTTSAFSVRQPFLER
jgi:hypothetical protein